MPTQLTCYLPPCRKAAQKWRTLKLFTLVLQSTMATRTTKRYMGVNSLFLKDVIILYS